MPKINIYEPRPGLPTGRADRRASIGWSRGQHAQIGIGWVVDPAAEAAVLGEQVDWAADFMLSGEKDDIGRVWQTQWINLDRPTINQLIRELRKARDQGFGADE